MGTFVNTMKSVVPVRFRPMLRRVINRTLWRLMSVVDTSDRLCPVCLSKGGKFLPYGAPPRDDVECGACGSLERHRLQWLYWKAHSNLFDGKPKRILHIAPEPCFAERLSRLPGVDYLSGDLDPRYAMMQMDVTDLPFPDNTFDVVICSHVLEHVPDDRKAMREFVRVLKIGGSATLQVPPSLREVTYEDWTITTPQGRRKAFGQEDHVRDYGKDYPERLREAGFKVTVDKLAQRMSPNEVKLHGIDRDEELYWCVK